MGWLIVVETYPVYNRTFQFNYEPENTSTHLFLVTICHVFHSTFLIFSFAYHYSFFSFLSKHLSFLNECINQKATFSDIVATRDDFKHT